ncbi:GNAT family N-acetyltransferase [Parachryseolinea silvisoli]|jgi:ribosomal protein S18 acetylase RimI-like enzyme|uniref:GNAT family N-acetyltransferase n=1 Tax=Parachryseolinea silvisoli TaxID=2873601 RepID=UPI0022659887|nr:GNAT family N-acetyltransferase [Parachryseolinea silvisoli]MCD9016557.1 GNAT family N-acetyltransferase [Parachryseolinea silvisoli]
MTQQLTIRTATPADLPTLRAFEQGVILAERPFDPTLGPDPLRYYDLEGMITATHIELIVALLGDEIVGSGYARIERGRPYLNHQYHAYIGFMYVVPQHRGKGIANAVLEALQRWSVKQGITEMQLDVYYENTPAIKAYEKAGFIKHLITMRKPTADD